MRLILCHANCDFDSLGAAVGLSLLYPASKIFFSSGVQPHVDTFLAVYREAFPLIDRKSFAKEDITELFVVDTSASSQLGAFGDIVKSSSKPLHVIDHHVAGDLCERATTVKVEEVGSASTLVAEDLVAAGITPPPEYALAMALGIHADTGSLLYDSTTTRDIEALLFLARHGATPGLCRQFLGEGLTGEQKLVLEEARASLECRIFDGLEVGLSLVRQSHGAVGLGEIASELRSSAGLDVFFLIIEMRLGEFRVVGRAQRNHPYLKDVPDLGKLFRALGGGGHSGAASVVLSQTSYEEVVLNLTSELQRKDSWSIRAAEVMSFPVRTVEDTLSLSEGLEQLDRYGHSGLLVLDSKQELAGVISRRDISKGIRHNLGHAPIKAYMTRKLITATPQHSLLEIHELFAEHDIGRVPVVEDGKLLGIVTRSDLLKFYVGHEARRGKDPAALVSEWLKPDEEKVVELCRKAAAGRPISLFLVGGAVRDVLLRSKNSNYSFTDFDIVVHSDSGAADFSTILGYAEDLSRLAGGKLVQSAPNFGTATVLIPLKDKSYKVDLAAARTEHYPSPAADPTVSPGNLYEDLVRRDFSVNALAFALTGSKAGTVIDYFDGVSDLWNGVIRVLHPLSFVEDPSRVVRAARLAARRGFRLNEDTRRLASEVSECKNLVRDHDAIDSQPGLGRRFGAELKLLFSSPEWFDAIKLFWELRGFELLSRSFRKPEVVYQSFSTAKKLLSLLPNEEQKRLRRLLILLFFQGFPPDTFDSFCKRLGLPEKKRRLFADFEIYKVAISEAVKECVEPCLLSEKLRLIPQEHLYLYSCMPGWSGTKLVRRHLFSWRNYKSPLTGADLKALGFTPGPLFKEIQTALQREVFKHPLLSREEAIKFITSTYPTRRDGR